MTKRIFVRELSGEYKLAGEKERLWNANRVMHGDSLLHKGGPQMWNKRLIDPANGLTQTIHSHVETIAPGGKSHKHGHQNEAMLYVLEGRGYEIHDGIRYDWQAGDMAVVSNACVHQHFNASRQHPCKVLIMKTKPLFLFLNLMFQATVESAPKEPVPGWEDYTPESEMEAEFSESAVWEKGYNSSTFYTNGLIRQPTFKELPDHEKQKIVHPEDMPWEICAQGKLKHIVNENMNVRIKGHDAYMQAIAPKGRSGRHRHTWEEVIYVLEGKGYDLHWDAHADIQDQYSWSFDKEPKKFTWQAGDLVYIPFNTIHQHFNDSASGNARFIVYSARIFRWLGFTEIEQFEDASG
jgi:quercetin dioxygenase-like cupin family protein